MPDNKIINESKTFEVRDLQGPLGLINGENCYNCIVLRKKEEVKNAVISLSYKDYNKKLNYTVVFFRIYFSETKHIEVRGDKIDDRAFSFINKLKFGDTIRIDDIYYRFPGSENYRLRDVHPITIQIVDKR